MREIVFAGFGGQGVLTAGLIVSQIALFKGFNATWMPAYGAAMRGGTANCTVHYGDGPVHNPGQQAPDLLLAMNAPSLKKFAGIVRPGGVILANSDMVELPEDLRSDVTVVQIPCNTLADRVRNPKGANIVMIGAITALLMDYSYEEGIAGMNDMFRKKGKDKFEAANVAAFTAGYEAAQAK